MRHAVWVCCLAWGVLLTAGCGRESTPSAADTTAGAINVVSTVGMVSDMVENVGGARVAPVCLMGPGVDPHLYTAKTYEMRMLKQADVVFYSGLMLEGKLIDGLKKIGKTQPVYEVTSAIPAERLLQPSDAAGHYDPHVWMDVATWSSGVSQVVAGLSKQAPQWEAEFRERGERYQQRLRLLDGYARETLATIPESNRVLITSHDAFNYFGRAYGLNVLGIQGLSTESEAGLKRINDLVDLIVEQQVKAVFVESSVPPKNIRALIDGAGARGHQVVEGGMLYSDAMGEADSPAGTYIGMIEHNVNTVSSQQKIAI